MNAETYFALKKKVIEMGYQKDIDWIANIKPCESALEFRNEAIWVILNSGMKEQVARIIYERLRNVWFLGLPSGKAFNHRGKCKAIDEIRADYQALFQKYLDAPDKLEYLQGLPFIGKITKFHLAKNLGIDCVKPDRHIVRIAYDYGYIEYIDFINRLIQDTGEKASMIDMVIWRAANLGLL